MIIDTKIDLTEHRDFSEGLFDRIFLSADPELINRAISIHDNEIMSNEDFEVLLQYEKIFGIKLHSNQASAIFSPTLDAYRYDMQTHCQRCGKEFRIPWKRKYDLCEDCDSIVSHEYYNLPWRKYNNQIVRFNAFDDARDIFNLR